jgi:hypothetical protein
MLLDAVPTDTITVEIDRRAVFDAALDLRVATLRSIALCRDILDRLAERRDPAPEVRDV